MSEIRRTMNNKWLNGIFVGMIVVFSVAIGYLAWLLITVNSIIEGLFPSL